MDQMNNQAIYRFINSRDIRNYLEDISYQFSVPEYAFLIWQCRSLTIEQRHLEFLSFIESTKSCTIKTSTCRDGWDLHQTINDMISLENRLVGTLLISEPNSFYIAEWPEYNNWHGDNCFFNNYGAAYEYAMKNADKNTMISFRIRKQYCDNSVTSSSLIESTYNSDGEMMAIDTWGAPLQDWSDTDQALWSERFDDMWFDIPIPFKPGDIVCDRYDNIPFVITSTVPWYRKEHPPKKNTGILHLTNMDMTASGYSVNRDTLSVKYDWLSHYYLNLEYYTDELKEEGRILTVYSLFKQDKINGDTLSKLTQLIAAEHLAKKAFRDIDWMLEEDTVKQLDLEKYRRKSHD